MAKLSFISPLEGDVLITGSDGILRGDCLAVPVCVQGPEDCAPLIQEIPGQWNGEHYEAEVLLKPGCNRISAVLPDGTRKDIRVMWLKDAEKTAHFTVDDCILCMKDLTLRQDEYTSLFENPYLAIWKRMHETYGYNVHINLFYDTEDGSFNLSMMTDRYRDEFRANADWMSFSFHAVREFPDMLYQHATYSQVEQDCEMVKAEIVRFAGEEVMRNSTTLHWGEATLQGVRALRDHGYPILCGYLELDHNEEAWVSYYLDREQVKHVAEREACVDFDEGVFFSKLNYVLDKSPWSTDLEKTHETLDGLAACPHKGQMLQTVIHEQYFYPGYVLYEPDYESRIMHVAKWAKEHGYRPISMTKLVLPYLADAKSI